MVETSCLITLRKAFIVCTEIFNHSFLKDNIKDSCEIDEIRKESL